MRRISTGRLPAVRTAGGRSRSRTHWLRPLFDRRKAGRKGLRFLSGMFAREAEQAVKCDVGSVVNFSCAGLRVRSIRRLQGKLKIELWSAKDRVTVWGQVVWSKRVGVCKYEAGLRFRDVTEETARRLADLTG